MDRARGAARVDYARATVQGVVGVLHHDTASVGALDTVAGGVIPMDGRTDIRAGFLDEVVEGHFPEGCPRGRCVRVDVEVCPHWFGQNGIF